MVPATLSIPSSRSLFCVSPVCCWICTVIVLSSLFRITWKVLLPVYVGAEGDQKGTPTQLTMVWSSLSKK